jgi:Ca2+-binding RTX toxin-like protein
MSKLGSTGQLKSDYFRVGDHAVDKNDYIVYNNHTGALFYDPDGSGSKAAVQIAWLENHASLTYKDFFVI